MRRSAWLIAVCVLAAVLAACSKNNVSKNSAATTTHTTTLAAATAAKPVTASRATLNASAVEGSVTKVVEDVRPSVVKVDASGQLAQGGPFGLGQQTQAQGTGTGMVLDTSGHILTNNHVVTLDSSTAASSIKVALPDGKTVDAKVVGQDPQTDLAILQVGSSDAAGLKPIQWADPSSILVGEPVVAIGYALDLSGEPTVTTGVVSATNRLIDEQNGVTITGSIQTDAAINPGNSGGPLVDLNDDVIGINSAGLRGSANQPAEGLNFAISVATAKPIADELIANGKVTRGYLGIGAVTITQQLAQSDSLPVDHGAGVAQVTPGSPARQAGLQQGDIIVKIGDTPINNAGDLTNVLTKHGPGSKTQVTLYRGQSQRTVDLTLGQRPSGQ